LDHAACCLGYLSWPHLLRIIAPSVLTAWAANAGTVSDLGMLPSLLRLPGAQASRDPLSGLSVASAGNTHSSGWTMDQFPCSKQEHTTTSEPAQFAFTPSRGHLSSGAAAVPAGHVEFAVEPAHYGDRLPLNALMARVPQPDSASAAPSQDEVIGPTIRAARQVRPNARHLAAAACLCVLLRDAEPRAHVPCPLFLIGLV
jgi:hypothetical protein